ncbi:MAG: hypothetical protein Fur006_10260 [Coleofasciculaceae cyanobacterium]
MKGVAHNNRADLQVSSVSKFCLNSPLDKWRETTGRIWFLALVAATTVSLKVMLDGCSLKSEYMISADALKLTLENRKSAETESGSR